MRAVAGLLAFVLVALSLLSFLPLAPTNAWWARALDFPRLQLAATILLLGAALLALSRRPPSLLVAALGGAALLLHAVKLAPYQPLAAREAPGVAACEAGRGLRVLVANVRRDTEAAPSFLEVVAAARPDLILALETDAYWDEALSALAGTHPYQVAHIPEEATHYGLHLLSSRPLVEPEIRMGFGEDTPAVATGVALASGEVIGFHGLHPRPPVAFDQGTIRRDATIYAAALAARDAERPTVVAGDLNAVPWETTTERALRLGRLADPRVGRGFMASFDAESWWMRWPLDHVLLQPELALAAYEVLPGFGSDHFPVLAEICRTEVAAPAPLAAATPEDLAEAERAIAAARAFEPAGD